MYGRGRGLVNALVRCGRGKLHSRVPRLWTGAGLRHFQPWVKVAGRLSTKAAMPSF